MQAVKVQAMMGTTVLLSVIASRILARARQTQQMNSDHIFGGRSVAAVALAPPLPLLALNPNVYLQEGGREGGISRGPH